MSAPTPSRRDLRTSRSIYESAPGWYVLRFSQVVCEADRDCARSSQPSLSHGLQARNGGEEQRRALFCHALCECGQFQRNRSSTLRHKPAVFRLLDSLGRFGGSNFLSGWTHAYGTQGASLLGTSQGVCLSSAGFSRPRSFLGPCCLPAMSSLCAPSSIHAAHPHARPSLDGYSRTGDF